MSHLRDTIRSVVRCGGPGVCNIAVTNACNAACDFCSYARHKTGGESRVFVDRRALRRAMELLYRREIRYLTFTGGEPFLHPHLVDLVADAVQRGMQPTVVTNGSRLTPRSLRGLRRAGLHTLIVSIDAASEREHEENRGLPGVCTRIRQMQGELKRLSIRCVASVTINRLIRDYRELFRFLEDLGFDMVTFSYPKRETRSSSRVSSATSHLVDFTPEELAREFETILELKDEFPILNPRESLRDMIRYLRGEPQRFPCFGGFKYFYLDWNLDVWRCDMWPDPMCSIEEFDRTPFVRDDCTRCMSDCYRDSSVLLHFAVALSDALHALAHGSVREAGHRLSAPSTLHSIKALLEEWKHLRSLASRE